MSFPKKEWFKPLVLSLRVWQLQNALAVPLILAMDPPLPKEMWLELRWEQRLSRQTWLQDGDLIFQEHYSEQPVGAKQKQPVPHPVRILPRPPWLPPVPALNCCLAIELHPVWRKIPDSVVWNFASSCFRPAFLFHLFFKNSELTIT